MKINNQLVQEQRYAYLQKYIQKYGTHMFIQYA